MTVVKALLGHNRYTSLRWFVNPLRYMSENVREINGVRYREIHPLSVVPPSPNRVLI